MNKLKEIIPLIVIVLVCSIIFGLIIFVVVPGAIHKQKWMNGEIDGIKRIEVRTPGFNPRKEILTMDEYNRLVEKGIVVGKTLRR